MERKKLKKWVYLYDKWFLYKILPLFLLISFFMVWYDLNYGFYHFSFDQLRIYGVGIAWVVSLTLFWRVYVVIYGKEYFDPYWLSLNEKRRQVCSKYMLTFFVIGLFLLNHILLSQPSILSIFSYPILIFSIILILGFITYPLYQDKIMRIAKKNNVRNTVYIVLSLSIIILVLASLVVIRPDIFYVETGTIPSERFEMSRTQLDDDYYLLTGIIYREGYTPEDITIKNDVFCEKKGHHVRELDWYFFKHMQRSYTLREYRFLGKYSPTIYCVEEVGK